jgi:hypothetical protein
LSRKTRRRFVAALGAVAALAAAGFAIAYFTTTGSGNGSATVGTSSALTIHGTTSSTLYPGTSTPVNFTVDNPSSGHQLLGTIHLASIHACVGASSTWNGTACSNSGTEATTCEDFSNTASSTTKDFSMADVVSNQDVANGNGQTVTATGTLAMNDLASAQDACKNANLTLGFTS